MIIIEGPEGSGKSFLVEALRQKTGFNVFHSVGTPKSPEDLDERLERSKNLLDLRFIQDRSPWISEPIYSAFFDIEGAFALWSAYLGALKAMGAKVVYCRPPDDIIKRNKFKEFKAYKSESQKRQLALGIDRLISLYDDFMDQLDPWIRYDWTLKSGQLVVRSLTRVLNRRGKEYLDATSIR